MTLSDLESELATLGNGYELPTEEEIVMSVNRALRRLYTDRIITKDVRIAVRRLDPILYRKEIKCKPGDHIELPLDGASYIMRIHGNGKFRVTDGTTSSTYSVDSPNEAKLFRGFITYGGKITFWGSYSFTIYDFAVYPEVFSPRIDDIPEYNAKRIFDLRHTYGDFASFISHAVDKNGKAVRGCVLKEGRLEIDPDVEGEIMLSYRRMPRYVAAVEMIQEIDVPNEYLRLFTLLVAAYLWRSAEESLGSYYEKMYTEGLESTRRLEYDRLDNTYVDTNGWA